MVCFMKLRQLSAFYLSVAAFVVACMHCNYGNTVYAVSPDEFINKRAELYRFVKNTRPDLSDVICSTGLQVNTDDATNSYIQRMFEISADNAMHSDKIMRNDLAAELAISEDGIPFAKSGESERQLGYLMQAIKSTTENTGKLADAVKEVADNRNNAQNNTEPNNTTNDTNSVPTGERYGQSWDESELDEYRTCMSTLPNVADGMGNCNSTARSHMAYTAVTSRRSAQYALLYGSDAYTNELGFRMVDGRYCIAVGSAYTVKIGTKIDLVFDDDSVLKCILGDCKSDRDTDSRHLYCVWDGSVAEFIIDNSTFNKKTEKNPVNTALNQFGKIKKVVIIQ